ncbi:MAG TPA: hypothetical protein ENG51_03725 [Deltaproteobacteria bacterium]|nr:MAG: hypothetical protein DRG83_06220 [Deltaproteobacteria bacterium]RLB10067.1 MAG: hypothetical protein DRG59_00540 [Deltaproteobacteria bacterium]HDM75562.1 hypothetical protein [Deltaproteobacteria bacterium]HEC31285.1 hypothetical protein [Deltaproteobacteria bacterium]
MKERLSKIKESFLLFAKGLRERSTSALEAELKELENAFALILLGALTGMPAPPSYLGIKLLPFLEREIRIMICRSESLGDIFADWFDILDFG